MCESCNYYYKLRNTYLWLVPQLCIVENYSQLNINKMKKILGLLVAVSCSCFCVNAQSTTNNGLAGKQTQVCKSGQGKNEVSCYNTKYAENFRVCKSEDGYYICSETPGYYNSTYLQFIGVAATEASYPYKTAFPAGKTMINDRTVPQSQSYVNTPAGSQ